MSSYDDFDPTPAEESAANVLSLALAVVKPGGRARLLNEDNTADPAGWVAVDDAARSGRAFFVEVKDSLAAFDLDSPELVECGEQLERWAQSGGYPTLLVSSGRDGHRHLYVRSHDRLAVEERALSLGISKSAHRRAIRPPLSPHRTGFETALVRPGTVAEALEALGPSEHAEPRRKNLRPQLMRLIADGDVDNRYGGRSQMALAIASGLRAAGYDYAHFRVIMANRENLGGAKYHALEDGEGTEDPESFLARTWEKAAAQLTPEMILAEIATVRVAVQAADWSGRTGNTDRAVMLALCELGTASGTTVLTFGVRRIALVAQAEDRTVRKSLGRLVKARWLEREQASTLGEADTYRFGPKVDKMTAPIPSPHMDMCGNNDQTDHDRVLLHPVFRNGSGLGKSTGRTWLVLRDLARPVTAKELADAVAGQRRTVDRHLSRLEQHGLAAKADSCWAALGDSRLLDELAVALGAVERSELQAERYERNRAGFRLARGLDDPRQSESPESGAPDDSIQYLPVSDSADEAEFAAAEEEFRRWYEEQLLLEQLGLPNELI